MVDRVERRIPERIFQFMCRPFMYLSPTLLTTPIDTLAKALIANTIFAAKDANKIEIIDNAKIFDLASLYDTNN